MSAPAKVILVALLAAAPFTVGVTLLTALLAVITLRATFHGLTRQEWLKALAIECWPLLGGMTIALAGYPVSPHLAMLGALTGATLHLARLAYRVQAGTFVHGL